MIIGAHSILYSKQPDADRAFLRDVLSLPHVDVGDGWLIFGLPPAEVAVHPSSENDVHELYLLCADVEAFVTSMWERGVTCGPVQSLAWGRLTELTLPGGGRLGVYQPAHERPEPVVVGKGKSKKLTSKAGSKDKGGKAKRPELDHTASGDQQGQPDEAQETADRQARKAARRAEKAARKAAETEQEQHKADKRARKEARKAAEKQARKAEKAARRADEEQARQLAEATEQARKADKAARKRARRSDEKVALQS